MRSKPRRFSMLAAAMAARDISTSDLAERTGIKYKTMCRKLNGDSDISVTEALSIVSAIDPKLTVEKAFSQRTSSTKFSDYRMIVR